MNTIKKIEKEQLEKLIAERPVPDFAPGDTLRVNVKVVEGTRERIQVFEGVCIARKNAGLNSGFTVRKLSYGEGVERVFPMYSPIIASIDVVRRGDVRRAKLYYLRGLTGKRARIAEKTDWDSAKKKAKGAENAETTPEEVTEEKAPTKDVVKKEAKKKKNEEKVAMPETGKAEEVTEEVVAEATEAAEKEAAKEKKAKDDS